MGILTGKKALIFGVANERSIAWGIAQAFRSQGATLGFSYHPAVEKHALPLLTATGSAYIEPCDVGNDEEILKAAQQVSCCFGPLDILVHCIGFANREELVGPYYNTTRAGVPYGDGYQRVLIHRAGEGLPAVLSPGQRPADPHLLRL